METGGTAFWTCTQATFSGGEPMKNVILLLAMTLLCGCVSLPSGEEHQHTFIQKSDMPYRQAYGIIAIRMRACYQIVSPFGNGYGVDSHMDVAEKRGTIVVYPLGLLGSRGQPSDSLIGRTITVSQSASGSRIVITGTSPLVAYKNHLMIPKWLAGNTSC